MLEKQILANQEIIQFLKIYYNLEVTKLALLPLGADMDASVYKATANNQSYFVKIKRGYHDSNTDLLDMLYQAGIQVIPALKTVDEQSNQHVKDHTIIVYPFVEGQDGFTRHLTEDQWQKLGKSLKKLHEINVPLSIQSKIRREEYSPKWRELVRSHCIALKNEISQYESKPDEITVKLKKFIKQNMSKIQRLVDHADELVLHIHHLSPPPECILCHSDIHGGNVLIDPSDAIYIVDWDDPIMAPKERDLMFIGGGIANVWNNPYEEKLFYDGYGNTEINKTILAYYRHERIVEDIALYIQAILFEQGKGEDRSLMYKQFLDMFVVNGVIDIAFRTYENL